MSAYKRIKCTIQDKDTLIKALAVMGLTAQIHDAPQALRGYSGDLRQNKAEIIVLKEDLNTVFTGASNDLGFTFNNAAQSYDIICSEYDLAHNLPARVKQAYAKVVIEEALENQYFSVNSTPNEQLSQRPRVKVQVVGQKYI